ncbi:MAG: LytTR family DNA-binding domain-containing protein, partial [Chitinophagales bacterium]
MNKLQFFTNDGYCWVKVEDILYFQAEAKKAKLFLRQSLEVSLNMNLNDCLKKVPQNYFFLINRSILVNLNQVFRLVHLKGNRADLILVNNNSFE